MIYLVAIFIPPLALIMCGKIVQAIFNGMLWVAALIILIFSFGLGFGVSFVLWIICVIHAILAANSHKADVRNKELINSMKSTE